MTALTIDTAEESYRLLLKKVAAGPDEGHAIARWETYLPHVDLLQWLQRQDAAQKMYWSGRDRAFAVAGIGSAETVTNESQEGFEALFGQMQQRLKRQSRDLRFYGGFRFDTTDPAGTLWAPFKDCQFTIPELEVGKRGEDFYVACNWRNDGTEDLSSLLKRLEAVDFSDTPAESLVQRALSRTDRPNFEAWPALVGKALESIEAGQLRKVVLARESRFEFERPVDALQLLQSLVENTVFSYHFCFQVEQGLAFIGASPERLYKRHNVYVQSEALAGTRPRGATPEEDEALGKELLHCDKEVREHRFVLDTIRDVFSEYCRAVQGAGRLELLALRHCQHLITKIEGLLSDPNSDAALLESLHPTPAVGGVPTDAALAFIGLEEPFERGWFAAPVGWVGYDSAEFAVAIRSGLVAGNTLTLYSGAGIVPGSDAESEWSEIENKMQNFLRIVNAPRTPE